MEQNIQGSQLHLSERPSMFGLSNVNHESRLPKKLRVSQPQSNYKDNLSISNKTLIQPSEPSMQETFSKSNDLSDLIAAFGLSPIKRADHAISNCQSGIKLQDHNNPQNHINQHDNIIQQGRFKQRNVSQIRCQPTIYGVNIFGSNLRHDLEHLQKAGMPSLEDPEASSLQEKNQGLRRSTHRGASTDHVLNNDFRQWTWFSGSNSKAVELSQTLNSNAISQSKQSRFDSLDLQKSDGSQNLSRSRDVLQKAITTSKGNNSLSQCLQPDQTYSNGFKHIGRNQKILQSVPSISKPRQNISALKGKLPLFQEIGIFPIKTQKHNIHPIPIQRKGLTKNSSSSQLPGRNEFTKEEIVTKPPLIHVRTDWAAKYLK